MALSVGGMGKLSCAVVLSSQKRWIYLGLVHPRAGWTVWVLRSVDCMANVRE